MRIPESYDHPFADYGRYRSLRITERIWEINDFLKLPSATSFIRKTLYEIPNYAFRRNFIQIQV